MGDAPLSLINGNQRSRFTSVYSLLEQAVATQVFPGCAFGVLVGRGVVALDGIGRQTYAESPAIDPSTTYDLASLTKVLATTAMAMLLHQRGALPLDQPLAAVLPEFGVQDGRASVTLRHLLAHSSGLAGYARLFETERSPEALLHACLHMPLLHPPGTHAEYSDIGFILLGKALEAIAGDRLDSFCLREIFLPLQMGSTGFRPPAAASSEVPSAAIPPTEEDTTLRHRVIQGEVQDENCWVLGGISGHAGLFGNALDVLRFSAAMLNAGSFIDQETLLLFAARSNLPLGSSRALGWDTPSENSSSGALFSVNSIGHLGYAGTSLWIDLDARIAVVLLTNRTWPDRQNQRIRSLRPAFHDAVRQALSHERVMR